MKEQGVAGGEYVEGFGVTRVVAGEIARAGSDGLGNPLDF
jgi:hypothetical protein